MSSCHPGTANHIWLGAAQFAKLFPREEEGTRQARGEGGNAGWQENEARPQKDAHKMRAWRRLLCSKPLEGAVPSSEFLVQFLNHETKVKFFL